jgi:hypothetical protein
MFSNDEQSKYMGMPPNDPGDAGIGPNTLQNKPVITSARAYQDRSSGRGS